MKKNNKMQLLCIIIMICIGFAGVCTVIGVLGRRFDKNKEKGKECYALSKTKLEAFNNIDIDVESAEIEVIPADDYYLEYKIYKQNGKPFYKVKEDKFTFQDGDSDNEFFQVNFNIGMHDSQKEYIRLYVPEGKQFQKIVIDNSAGKLNISNLAAESLKADCESGDIEMKHITVPSLKLEADYGNVSLKEIQTSEVEMQMESGNLDTDSITCTSFDLQNSYGNVNFGEIAGETINITMESGNLEVNNVKTNIFDVENDYGNLKFGTISSNETKFSQSSGNFNSTTLETNTLELENEYGKISIGKLICEEGNIIGSDGDINIDMLQAKRMKMDSEYGAISFGVIGKIQDYNYKLRTEEGSVHLPDDMVDDDEKDYGVCNIDNQKDAVIEVESDGGNITLRE